MLRIGRSRRRAMSRPMRMPATASAASAGLAKNRATSAACPSSSDRRSAVEKSYCGSLRISEARLNSVCTDMPCSTYATNAAAQAAQAPKAASVPAGMPRNRRSPARRPSRNMPMKATGAAKALWGKASTLRLKNTPPSAIRHSPLPPRSK